MPVGLWTAKNSSNNWDARKKHAVPAARPPDRKWDGIPLLKLPHATCAYLRQYSPPAAARVRKELRDAMRSLGTLRRMGHPRLDLTDDPVLFFSVPPYHVIYRPDLEPIEIVRVIHGARDVASELRRR